MLHINNPQHKSFNDKSSGLYNINNYIIVFVIVALFLLHLK